MSQRQLSDDVINWAHQAMAYAEQHRHKITDKEIDQYQKWLFQMQELIKIAKTNASENNGSSWRYEHEQADIRGKTEKLYQQLQKLFQPQFKKGAQTKSDTVQTTAQPSGATKQEKSDTVPRQTVPIGQHTLPPLPYPYDALEPYIEEEIMRLHHDVHHQSYVDGLNEAERKMREARRTGNFDLLKHWEREAAFHGSGHYLHTIFWDIMSPEGGGQPSGDLANEINKTFGSFQRFKQHFTEAADKVEGVGWAILVWAPRAQRLEILQAEKHQHFAQWDVIPLLVLDVWEHAYYLQYKTDRKKYIENWWNIVNWDAVNNRLRVAKQVRWTPY
ncbi:superoxide dismutase [Caldalkalibacillus salinus]|uniref:superoxide dismutase n=1 Tax=Caldalkalibacillus salinus TaxID=2803787 RepID=UPI001F2220D3|nr:superoxide dismutase [Caldalkalibacillus salinus]